MTGLLQWGWTPLSLCHRYECRKLVLKWHPDKHPEGRGVVPSVDYVTLRAHDEDDAAGLHVMWKTYLLDFKVWTPSQAHLVDRFLVFFVFGLIHRIILKMRIELELEACFLSKFLSGREEAEEKIRAINNAYVAWLHLSSQIIILIHAMVVHL